jgi:hypothetical protein
MSFSNNVNRRYESGEMKGWPPLDTAVRPELCDKRYGLKILKALGGSLKVSLNLGPQFGRRQNRLKAALTVRATRQ